MGCVLVHVQNFDSNIDLQLVVSINGKQKLKRKRSILKTLKFKQSIINAF